MIHHTGIFTQNSLNSKTSIKKIMNICHIKQVAHFANVMVKCSILDTKIYFFQFLKTTK